MADRYNPYESVEGLANNRIQRANANQNMSKLGLGSIGKAGSIRNMFGSGKIVGEDALVINYVLCVS